MRSTPAMLSNPWLSSSAGSSCVGSICRSSRSRTALPYSVRFRRWTGLCPGSGEASARRSSVCSRLDGERVQRRFVGTRGRLRRHHAATELEDHLLPDVRVGGRRLIRVEILKNDVAGLHAVVVTGRAVLLHERRWHRWQAWLKQPQRATVPGPVPAPARRNGAAGAGRVACSGERSALRLIASTATRESPATVNIRCAASNP